MPVPEKPDFHTVVLVTKHEATLLFTVPQRKMAEEFLGGVSKCKGTGQMFASPDRLFMLTQTVTSLEDGVREAPAGLIDMADITAALILPGALPDGIKFAIGRHWLRKVQPLKGENHG